MIAVSILSVGLVSFIAGFRYISESLGLSRGRSVATELAQDKIEKLSGLSYSNVVISTGAAYTDTNFTPNLTYGQDYEEFNVANVRYRRGTYVSYAVMSGNTITGTSQSGPDTGTKIVSVYVVWKFKNRWKKVVLQHFYNDPNLRQISSTITGQVNNVTLGGTVSAAKVYVAENTNWMSKTDSLGNYSLGVIPGTWTVRASSGGYYDWTSGPVVVQANNSTTVDPALVLVATVTIYGAAWVNPDLVVSQVVSGYATVIGDGATAVNSGSSGQVEYVELYNPTTAPVSIATAGGAAIVNVGYDDKPTPANNACDGVQPARSTVYFSTYVAAGGYYLIADATFFLDLGTTYVRADAYWTTTDKIKAEAGCVYLTRNCGSGSANRFNSVAWRDNSVSPNACGEGTAIPLTAAGLATGQQLVRISSPLITSDTLGRAYDSGSNDRDFLYTAAGAAQAKATGFRVFSTTPTYVQTAGVINAPQGPPITGIVLTTAAVSTDEDIRRSTGIGRSTTTFLVTIASGSINIPYSYYILSGVSTGAVNVFIASQTSSGLYFQQITTITVNQSISTGVANGATTPSWIAAGYPSVSLSSVSAVTGILKGNIQEAGGNGARNVYVRAHNQKRLTQRDGYSMALPAGTYTMIVNADNANMDFVEYSTEVTVSANQITTQNVTLSQGGLVYGYVTVLNSAGTGSSPLPNQTFKADNGVVESGYGTSDASGYFYIRNLTTGTYTVSPVLDSKSAATPPSYAGVTVTKAASVFVGTFTVSDAYGLIVGTVKLNTQPVGYGSLILASTDTIATAPYYVPPLVYGSSVSALGAVIYSASSKGDGTYQLPVRGNASPYNMYFYLPIDTEGNISISTHTASVTVGVGGAVTHDENF